MNITKTKHLHNFILFAICDQVSTFDENQGRIAISSEIFRLNHFLVADVSGLQALLLAALLLHLLLLPLLCVCPVVGGEEHPVEEEVCDAGDGAHHGRQTERVVDAHSGDQEPAQQGEWRGVRGVGLKNSKLIKVK